MKKSESFRLACYNLKTFKKSRKQYFVSIFMVTFFMMLFCSVSLIIKQMYDGIIYDRISTNFINIYLTLDSEGQEISDEASELLQKIKSLDHVNLGAKYTLLNLLGEEECYSVNIKEVKCFIQGKEYAGEDDYSFDFTEEKSISKREDKEKFSVFFSVDVLDIESEMFSENTLREYQYKYDSDIFLCGRELQREKELVISEYMLNRFGIYEDYDSLLNHKITIQVNRNKVLEDYTIVGIINSDYYRVLSECDRSQVMISGTSGFYSDFEVKELIQKVSIDSFAESEKFIESIDTKYDDYYYVSSTIYMFGMVDKFQLICKQVISVFISMVVIAMIMKLVSNVYINRKSRAYYYGILKAMGMEEWEIIRISFYELFILLCFCMILSAVLTFLVLKLLQYIIVQSVGYFIAISVQKLAIAIILTGGMVSLLMIVISVVMNVDLIRKSIINVINS